MKRPLLLLILVGVLVAMMAPGAAGGGPPSASPIQGKWERLSPADFDPDPELAVHEVRVFHRTGDEWVSTYKVQNDPRLGDPQRISDTLGDFRGVETDVAGLDCGLFGCLVEGIAYGLTGESTFGRLSDEPFQHPTVFVTTESGLAWWIGEYDFRPFYYGVWACPWYPSFDEALAANPTFATDCIAAEDYTDDGKADWQYGPVEQHCSDGYDNDGDGHVDSDDPDCSS